MIRLKYFITYVAAYAVVTEINNLSDDFSYFMEVKYINTL